MPTWAVLALPPPSRPSCHQCRRLLPAPHTLEGPRIPRERHTPLVELPRERGLGCPLPPDGMQPHAAAIPGGDPTDDWTAAAPSEGPMSVQTSTQRGPVHQLRRRSASRRAGQLGRAGPATRLYGRAGGAQRVSATRSYGGGRHHRHDGVLGGGASESKAGEILQTGRGPSMALDKKYKGIPGRFHYVMVQCAPSVWSKQSHASTVVAGS